MQRSKQKRTMADMRTIATAWEARATDMNRYDAAGVPSTLAGSARQLRRRWTRMLSPTYIKTLPQNDGWGNPCDSTSTSLGSTTDGQIYAIQLLR